MKFLHEMIAKKRQAQVEEQGAKADAAQAYELPEMSAVSPDALPIAGRSPEGGEDASASIIPYRQRHEDVPAAETEDQRSFAPQSNGYDWDVSDIDLSGERASTEIDDTDEAPFAEDSPAPEQDGSAHTLDMSEPELEFDRPEEHRADDPTDHADEDPEDEPDQPASALADDHGSGGDVPEEAPRMSQAADTRAEEDADATGAMDEAEESDMDEPESNAQGAAVRHKSAAEAAASLARQVQQRKIWDIQPPAAVEEDAPKAAVETQEEPEADPEPVAETVSEPVAETASEPESAAEPDPAPEPETVTVPMQTAPATEPAPEPVATEGEDAPQTEPAKDAAPEAPDLDEAQPDAAMANAEDEDPDLADAPAPARRRTGRVKTRLLGFHKPEDESVDPISAASQSPVGEARFPVGWVVVLQGPGRGASFTLTAGASKIGRGEDQTVRLDFGDNSISRDNHAVVAYDDEQRRFFIGHGGKANLVRLNDMPVLSTEPLSDGDTIRIGETTLLFTALCGPEFSWDDEDVEPAHAASH